jgi:hypothetical protein
MAVVRRWSISIIKRARISLKGGRVRLVYAVLQLTLIDLASRLAGEPGDA